MVPTRDEMIAALKAQDSASAPAPASPAVSGTPSREEMISALKEQDSFAKPPQETIPWYDLPSNLVAGLQKIDEYTGAPIRKFVTEKATGEKLEKAPTGAEQAKRMGAPTTTYKEAFGVPGYLGGNISPADIYGVGLEAVQDPFVIGGAVVGAGKKLLGGAKSLYKGAESVSRMTGAQRQSAEAIGESTARTGSAIKGGGVAVEQGGTPFTYRAPRSLDELNAWSPEAGSGEMLGKSRLRQIEEVVPDLRTKPLKYHYDMMENPKAMKELKLQFENLPTESAKKIAAYNQEIVEESARKVKQTVKDISGADPRSLSDAGDDFINVVKSKYSAEKEALGPAFESFRKNAAPLSRAESRDLAIAISQNTKVGKLLTQAEDGRLMLAKNTPRTGIADDEFSVLARVIDDLNDGMTFKDIQNTRAYLLKKVDPANPGATSELGKVRSIMLNYLESMAAKQGDEVGRVFKAYAVNERRRESIEKIIGGKLESLDAMYNANPERVVQKIFANPNHAKIIGDYVGPEKMKELAAAYINKGVSSSFDSAKGFKPHELKAWIKTNQAFLKANVDPAVSQRLEALADYGYYGKRFLDEVNPSGTAASIKEMIQPGSFFQRVKQEGIVAGTMSEVSARAGTKIKQKQAQKAVNKMLGAETPASLTDRAGSAFKKLPESSKLNDGVKKFQQGAATVRGGSSETQKSNNKAADHLPMKGQAKWANDGLENLKEHSGDSAKLEDMKAKLLSDPKGRKLLIAASDLKPGSKAMDKQLERIERLYGASSS